MEQVLADDDGAPESKWYRHVFYGWNIYSLYDGQPFPGLAAALQAAQPGARRHAKWLASRAALSDMQLALTTRALAALAEAH